MQGKLFLGTAQFLQNKGTDEAAYRSAVSRAYYACFHETRQIAFDNCAIESRLKGGIKSVKNILHDPLRQYFLNSTNESIQQLSQDLASLHGNRKDADYQLTRSVSREDAKDAIEDAQALLNDLEKIPHSEIGKAMSKFYDKNYS